MALNIEKLKQKQQELERQTSGSDYTYMKLGKGENLVRILPPKEGVKDKNGEAVWYVEAGYHYDVGPNEESVCCPVTTPPEFGGGGSRCPICELVKKLYKTGDEDDKKQAQDIKATKRFFVNAVNAAEAEAGVQVLAHGVTIYKGVLSWITDPEYGDVTDPNEGYNLKINKAGDGRDTEYTVKPGSKNPTKLSDIEGYDEKWLTEMPDLMALAKPLTYDEIVAIMNGEKVEKKDDKSGDGDAESEGESSNSKPTTKPAKDEKAPKAEASEAPKQEYNLEELLKNPPMKCFSKDHDPKDKMCVKCDHFEACGKATELKAEAEETIGGGTPEAAEEAPADKPKESAASSKAKDLLNKYKK